MQIISLNNYESWIKTDRIIKPCFIEKFRFEASYTKSFKLFLLKINKHIEEYNIKLSKLFESIVSKTFELDILYRCVRNKKEFDDVYYNNYEKHDKALSYLTSLPKVITFEKENENLFSFIKDFENYVYEHNKPDFNLDNCISKMTNLMLVEYLLNNGIIFKSDDKIHKENDTIEITNEINDEFKQYFNTWKTWKQLKQFIQKKYPDIKTIKDFIESDIFTNMHFIQKNCHGILYFMIEPTA